VQAHVRGKSSPAEERLVAVLARVRALAAVSAQVAAHFVPVVENFAAHGANVGGMAIKLAARLAFRVAL
jgi:hypothetical protein